MKHYTTIEQSKKLLSLGLSPDTADMVYLKYADTDDPTPRFEGAAPMILMDVPINEIDCETLACWSLGALLEVMPQYLYNEDGDFFMVSLDHNSEGWNVSYSGEDEYNFSRFADENGSTPIEAAYSMVVWLLENGYIKKESDN